MSLLKAEKQLMKIENSVLKINDRLFNVNYALMAENEERALRQELTKQDRAISKKWSKTVDRLQELMFDIDELHDLVSNHDNHPDSQ